MATYKVIQDIEAEDKLVGPLSLRQFIYAGIVVVLGFIAYQLSMANPILASPLLIPILFFAALAAPLGKDQPSEVWLLAKVRFFLKPRKRIWNQDGISQLVTITAPKKIEHIYTDGLSQNEVKSRLSALATTLDSRGWAVKNVSVNLYGQAGYLNNEQGDSDRLVSASSLPQDVPAIDVTAVDDMMDEAASPTAQNLERMISQSEQAHRQQLVDTMSGKAPAAAKGQQPPADYWFMNQQQPAPTKPGYVAFDHNPVVAPGTPQDTKPQGAQTADEQALLSKIHTDQSKPSASYGHMKTILPIDEQAAANKKLAAANNALTPTPKPANPDIIRLASNDDLNIATIAREAQRDNGDGGEVVISLH